jgi:hypothetical protein
MDLNRDYTSDAAGKDPDKYSPSLNEHHRVLWQKPLPNGKIFNLETVKDNGFLLLHRLENGEDLYLSSDALGHSLFPDYDKAAYSRSFPYEAISNQLRDVIEDFWAQQVGISWYIIFPAFMRDGHTINQARGVNPKICDRFDLTLECIRRYYRGEKGENPLQDALNRYKDFFDLFVDFEGYVAFFYLQDLLEEKQSSIKFWLPFDEFKRPPLPQSPEEYKDYKDKVCSVFAARRDRIAKDLNKSSVEP